MATARAALAAFAASVAATAYCGAASAQAPWTSASSSNAGVLWGLSAPTNLQVEYLDAPRGVDRTRVQFTWSVGAVRGGAAQVSARVVVRSNATGTVVFDSGVVATSRPELANREPLPPMAIQSDTVYAWTVEVQWPAAPSDGGEGGGSRDSRARAGGSVVSAPATFSTGLLAKSDWAATWIRGGTQMRTTFEVAPSTVVARASLFISACHYYTVFLDGVRVGDQVLDSPWTSFYTNRSYTTHNISPSALAPSKHTIGIRVGQGFCASTPHDEYDPNAERSVIAQLQLHGPPPRPGAEQPVVQRVATGETGWTASDGPILQDSTYYGEVYDARREQPGWATPAFVPPEGRSWGPVSTNFAVVAQLASQLMQPVRPVREVPALSVTPVRVNLTQQRCAVATEGAKAAVSCTGSTIASVTFASFGTPVGDCESGLSKGSCASADNLTAFVSSACVGQESCSISCIGRVPPPEPNGKCTATSQPAGATKTFVEGEPCMGVAKHLAIEVACKPPPAPLSEYKYVFDFGQEFAGVVRLTLPRGTPRGTVVTLKHAEALAHPPNAPRDGSVWMGNLFWANPVDVYTAKGGPGAEVYEPSFTYHGFRYVELSVANGTLPEPPNASTVVGVNLRSSVPESATLRFGADPHAPGNLVQRLSNNSWWTEAAALMSIPAGAAGRGERNGWTGDAAFASESECFDFDTAAFFSRYLEQVTDAQGPNGEIGGGVPGQGTAPTTIHAPQVSPFDPSWSAVFPVVAYNLWKAANCTLCLDRAWPGLALYYEMLRVNYTVCPHTYGMWGDWNPAYPPPGRTGTAPGPPFVRTVSAVTSAAMVVLNIDQAAEMARATGRRADAERYEAMLPSLREAFHASFFDPIGNVYGDGTPTAMGAALWLGVTPPGLLPAVVDNFVRILAGVGYRMDTVGFIGVRYVFEALTRVNRTDVALRMLAVTDYPSYGWAITNSMEPATSLWESWDVPTMHQWVDESSRDHHYQASINTFLRKCLAGLDQPRGSSAWQVVKCRPEAARHPDLLGSGSATLQSRRGRVACSWRASPTPGLPPAPSPPSDQPATLCAMTPIFTGALQGPSPMVLRCPAGATITGVAEARWGKETNSSEGAWRCWGPQPTPRGLCEADVSAKIAPLCVGKPSCHVSGMDNVATLGDPCKGVSGGDQRFLVRVNCSKPAAGVNKSDGSARSSNSSTGGGGGAAWVQVNASVPGGSAGEVHVPLVNVATDTVTESGVAVFERGAFVPGAAPGVTGGGVDGGFAWFAVGPGDFVFSGATAAAHQEQ